MPDRRMGPFSRFIGGWVNLLAYTYDQVAPFWQTPREVEWAKAAADGLAEREAEEEVSEPCRIAAAEADGVFDCQCADCLAVAAAIPPLEDDPVAKRLGLVPETSAPTPGAVDGPAEGEPPEPSAGVGLGNVVDECLADLARLHLAPSAEVEPPASAPSAESPAPEFDWVTTAIPVISEVLAGHKFLPIMGRCECPSLPRVADWQRWREHVSPIITIAIQSNFLSTIYEDTTFAINAFSGDRPRPLADFPKHQK